jgi:hypothetical protein
MGQVLQECGGDPAPLGEPARVSALVAFMERERTRAYGREAIDQHNPSRHLVESVNINRGSCSLRTRVLLFAIGSND